MRKLSELKGVVGRVEIGISRESGVKFEVEGLSFMLGLMLFDHGASILQCTLQ